MDVHLASCQACREVIVILSGGSLRSRAGARLSSSMTKSLDTPVIPRVGQMLEPGLRPGARIGGRYRVVELLGRGGMGEVYLAEDEISHQRVALKTIAASLASDDRANRRLRRELTLARRVAHPNVCRLFELGNDGMRLYLTMEFLPGETLGRRLRTRGRLPEADEHRVAAQLCFGLAAAHDAGVLHRDLKSDNVILVAEHSGQQKSEADRQTADKDRRNIHRAVICDFGLARPLVIDPLAGPGEDSTTLRGTVLGTPSHAAPEQLLGRPVAETGDIYALGVVLYEMVTGGGLPFSDANFAEAIHLRLRTDAPSPRLITPDLDPRWEAAIRRCLDRSPARRFQTARDLADALRLYEGRE